MLLQFLKQTDDTFEFVSHYLKPYFRLWFSSPSTSFGFSRNDYRLWFYSDVLTTPTNTEIDDAKSEIALSVIEVYSTDGGKELDDIIANLTKVYEGVEQTEIDSEYHSYPADELPVQIRPVPAQHLVAFNCRTR